jgi:hypothetical protein
MIIDEIGPEFYFVNVAGAIRYGFSRNFGKAMGVRFMTRRFNTPLRLMHMALPFEAWFMKKRFLIPSILFVRKTGTDLMMSFHDDILHQYFVRA